MIAPVEVSKCFSTTFSPLANSLTGRSACRSSISAFHAYWMGLAFLPALPSVSISVGRSQPHQMAVT